MQPAPAISSPEVLQTIASAQDVSSKSSIKEVQAQQKERKEFLDVTQNIRRTWFRKAGTAFKESMLADPEMWPSVRHLSEVWLDQFYLDVESEIERNLQYALLYQKERAKKDGPQSWLGLLNALYSIRAFVLHHYLPHDRSIFGKLNDKVYLLMYAATAVPIHGLRVGFFSVILLCIALPAPADEFQLVNFILLFKGMQFLTGGLMMLVVGAIQYFMCYSFHKDDLLQCMNENGPGSLSVSGQAIDYAGSSILCWIAFLLLALSTQPQLLQEQEEPKQETEEHKKRSKEQSSEAGGRLRHLLVYDVKCLVVSLCTLLVLTLLTCGDYIWGDERGVDILSNPQFRSNFYWACVLYSVLMLPFFFFMVPGLQTLLIHCDATGYNAQGACVMWELPPMPTVDGSAAQATGDDESLDRYLGWVNSAVRTLQKGADKRGGELSVTHMTGDFARGLGLLPTPTPVVIEEPGTASSSGIQDILQKGREARGDSDGNYQFGDFTRGVFKKMAGDEKANWWQKHLAEESGQPEEEAAFYTDGAPPESVLTLGMPLRVASVKMDASLITSTQENNFAKRRVYYDIEVIPEELGYDELELGASRPLKPWHVKRRFTEFYELQAKLHGLPNYADAPFPSKYNMLKFEEKVEFRRKTLEFWFNRVVQDEARHPAWSQLLREFLMPSDAEANLEDEPPSPSAGSEVSSKSVQGGRPSLGQSLPSSASAEPKPTAEAAAISEMKALPQIEEWLMSAGGSAEVDSSLPTGVTEGSLVEELPNWYTKDDLEGPSKNPRMKQKQASASTVPSASSSSAGSASKPTPAQQSPVDASSDAAAAAASEVPFAAPWQRDFHAQRKAAEAKWNQMVQDRKEDAKGLAKMLRESQFDKSEKPK